MNRIQTLGTVFLFDTFARSRVLVDKATQQAISLLEAGAQRWVSQTLFHRNLLVDIAQVTAGFFFHELEVVRGILPVQRSRSHRGLGLLGLVVIPEPGAHAHQDKNREREQHDTNDLDKHVFNTTQHVQHR